ncbi:hypothetical protein WR25_26249 [Diploscapter pachys]|uniref:G-protein coupled receptors family 1 profile domain-containing protein n=1 Tax=Diploscapter pachys TaxID=2018661 RepID=A0A2A2JSX6_9BILA|nr:hypothetical protein WR25_26249 [Diploscapter pachys]
MGMASEPVSSISAKGDISEPGAGENFRNPLSLPKSTKINMTSIVNTILEANGAPDLLENEIIHEGLGVYKEYLLAALIAFSILGVITNLWFLVVMKRAKHLSEVVIIFFANACVLNILYIIVHVPHYIITVIDDEASWSTGLLTCKVAQWLSFASSTSSAYFVALIGFDRFMVVFFESRHICEGQCSILTVAVWIIGFTLSIPYVINAHLDRALVIRPPPAFADDAQLKESFVFVLRCAIAPSEVWTLTIRVMIQYGIPTFILLPSYIYLIYSLWRRPVIGNVSQIRLERLKKTKKNLTTTIAAILFVQRFREVSATSNPNTDKIQILPQDINRSESFINENSNIYQALLKRARSLIDRNLT